MSLAHAWVDHLRAGGTTPWGRFADTAAASGYAEGEVPAGQQLELLRRLNLAGRPDGHLIRRVLTMQVRGRGRMPVPLPGADPDTPGHAVDPERLPARELLRWAATLVAEDLRTAGPPAPSPARVRRWRTTYRLAGDPWTGAALGSALTGAGHPPGGRAPLVLVLGGPLDQMVVHCWLARCFGRGAPAWPQFRDGALAAGHLPLRADLPRVVKRRRAVLGEAGRDRLRVVLNPDLVPDLVGLRTARRGWEVEVPGVPHHAAELARAVAAALSGQVPPQVQVRLLRGTLLARLRGASGPTTAVGPAANQTLREAAVDMARRLDRSGVTVLGGTTRLLPGHPESTAHEDTADAAALNLALELLLRPAPAGGRG